jgi:hypothetical protein
MERLGGGGAGWARVFARGGVAAVLRELSHGDRGWEIAGKGTGLILAALVADALFVSGKQVDMSNPFEVLSSVAAIAGLSMLIVGFTREFRHGRERLRAFMSADRETRTVAAVQRPASGPFSAVQSPTDETQPGTVESWTAETDDATAHTAGVPSEEVGASQASLPLPEEDRSVVETPLAASREGTSPQEIPSPSKPSSPTALDAAIRRSQQGADAEKYVAKVLSDLPRSEYKVVPGLMFKKQEIGRYIGDIDFVVLRRDGTALVTVEVKSTRPWVRGEDGRPCRDSFCEQAARQARATRIAAGESVGVHAIVTFVPPVAFAARDATRMRALGEREHRVGDTTVHSVGVKGLKGLVRRVLASEV